MKTAWKWIIGVVVVLVVLFALTALLGGYFGYGGMMGGSYGNWGHPMMGGANYSPFGGLFMGFGMLLVWVLPLAVLGLVIYAAVRMANKPTAPSQMWACTNCGKPIQGDWNNCPHCGTEL